VVWGGGRSCGSSWRPVSNDTIKWGLGEDIFMQVPAEVKARFYGCGNPIPSGIGGLTVLDLGCGSGRDCYVAASLVREQRTPVSS